MSTACVLCDGYGVLKDTCGVGVPPCPVCHRGICVECGNDDACEGYALCSDCLEATP